jgi:hypothetical protein
MPTIVEMLAYPSYIWRDSKRRVTWQKILHAEGRLTLHAKVPLGELIARTRQRRSKRGHRAAYARGTSRKWRLLRDGAQYPLSPRRRRMRRIEWSAAHPTHPARPPAGCANLAPDPPRSGAALSARLTRHEFPAGRPESCASGGLRARNPPRARDIWCRWPSTAPLSSGNAPERMRRIDARFTAPVFPGGALETVVWREAPVEAAFSCRAIDRDVASITAMWNLRHPKNVPWRRRRALRPTVNCGHAEQELFGLLGMAWCW